MGSDEQATTEDPDGRFTVAFQDHYGPVLAYLRNRIDTVADADDLAAQTFLAAWRRVGEMPVGEGVREWLFDIARGDLANYRRGRHRWRVLAERLGSVALLHHRERGANAIDSAQADEDAAMIAFRKLRSSQQETLRMIAWEGLTTAEAASRLGC